MKSYEDFKREVEGGPIVNSTPWEGKTTKDPLKDFERLAPEFEDAAPETLDAFALYTLRRLVVQRVPKEKAIELIKGVIRKLQDQGYLSG